MKTNLLILMLAFTLVGLNAWAGDSKIIVWQKDGSTTEILFNQMPEFLYDNGNVSLENGDTQLSWPLSSLEKFTFENVVPSDPSLPTDVKDLEKPI